MEWISVKKQPPKINGRYQCAYLNLCVFIAQYKDGKWLILSNEIGSALWNVTHWMPLPRPPEVTENAN